MKKTEYDWSTNQKDIVPTREQEGRCRKCNKILSDFNLTNYCFVHYSAMVSEEEEREQERVIRQQKYYKEKRKNAKSRRDSKRATRNCKAVV